MRVTLTNNFHDTETYVHVQKGDILSPRRIRDIRRRLCPDTCTCSGDLGTRGPQAVDLILTWEDAPIAGYRVRELRTREETIAGLEHEA